MTSRKESRYQLSDSSTGGMTRERIEAARARLEEYLATASIHGPVEGATSTSFERRMPADVLCLLAEVRELRLILQHIVDLVTSLPVPQGGLLRLELASELNRKDFQDAISAAKRKLEL